MFIDHERGGDQQERALGQRVVGALHGLHQQAADARPGEYRLDHHIAADAGAEAEREGGDDGQQSVARGVAHHDGPARQAFHAGHGDEFVIQDLEHGGAHQQQREALQVKRQCQCRQRQVPPDSRPMTSLPAERAGHLTRAERAAGREPAGLEREAGQQQHAEPEFGSGAGGERGGDGDRLDRRCRGGTRGRRRRQMPIA